MPPKTPAKQVSKGLVNPPSPSTPTRRSQRSSNQVLSSTTPTSPSPIATGASGTTQTSGPPKSKVVLKVTPSKLTGGKLNETTPDQKMEESIKKTSATRIVLTHNKNKTDSPSNANEDDSDEEVRSITDSASYEVQPVVQKTQSTSVKGNGNKSPSTTKTSTHKAQPPVQKAEHTGVNINVNTNEDRPMTDTLTHISKRAARAPVQEARSIGVKDSLYEVGSVATTSTYKGKKKAPPTGVKAPHKSNAKSSQGQGSSISSHRDLIEIDNAASEIRSIFDEEDVEHEVGDQGSQQPSAKSAGILRALRAIATEQARLDVENAAGPAEAPFGHVAPRQVWSQEEVAQDTKVSGVIPVLHGNSPWGQSGSEDDNLAALNDRFHLPPPSQPLGSVTVNEDILFTTDGFMPIVRQAEDEQLTPFVPSRASILTSSTDYYDLAGINYSGDIDQSEALLLRMMGNLDDVE